MVNRPYLRFYLGIFGGLVLLIFWSVVFFILLVVLEFYYVSFLLLPILFTIIWLMVAVYNISKLISWKKDENNLKRLKINWTKATDIKVLKVGVSWFPLYWSQLPLEKVTLEWIINKQKHLFKAEMFIVTNKIVFVPPSALYFFEMISNNKKLQAKRKEFRSKQHITIYVNPKDNRDYAVEREKKQ